MDDNIILRPWDTAPSGTIILFFHCFHPDFPLFPQKKLKLLKRKILFLQTQAQLIDPHMAKDHSDSQKENQQGTNEPLCCFTS